MASTLQSLQMAVFAATMDFVTVGEFILINYGLDVLGPAIVGQIPAGIPRNLVASSMRSAAELAKMIVYTQNAPKTGA